MHVATGFALAALVLAVATGVPSAAAAERPLGQELAGFARTDPTATRRIGERIWRNEAAGRTDRLVYWGPGEGHASLGIGHFIWYPAGTEGPFHESFQDLLAHFAAAGIDLPAWLRPGSDCPWPDRAAFLAAAGGPRRDALRALLAATVEAQTEFLIGRLVRALPAIAAAAPERRRAAIEAQLERMLRAPDGSLSPAGLYALVDYVNFKGEGTRASERYAGEGWGLLQVLDAMAETPGDGPAAFAAAAASVLRRRVALAPPGRREKRWLGGWLARVATYADAGRTEAAEAPPAWKPAGAAGTSWTIKGVRETTRDAVREAAAEADMLLGDWVDQALAGAAREALHPSPPPASKDDVAAVLEQLTELRAAVLALADAKASAEDLAAIRARMEELAEAKASAQDLAAVEARMQKLAERATGYDRPAVRHVMVEKKKPTRQPPQPRLPDKDPYEP